MTGSAARSTVVVVGDRGCEFCADDANMHFGHVKQVAEDDLRGALLQCPRCGWFYLDPRDGLSEPRHIEPADAASWFGFTT